MLEKNHANTIYRGAKICAPGSQNVHIGCRVHPLFQTLQCIRDAYVSFSLICGTITMLKDFTKKIYIYLSSTVSDSDYPAACIEYCVIFYIHLRSVVILAPGILWA